MQNRERGNVVLIILAIALVLFIISLFHTENNFYDTLNLTGILRLKCGLTIEHPEYKSGEKAVFPIYIEGYANGCGWEANAGTAGMAQVFDGKGMPLSKPTSLAVSAKTDKAPYSFTASVALLNPPSTDTGYILLTSTTGLISSIPIAF